MNKYTSLEKHFPANIITHKLLHFLTTYELGNIGRAATKMSVTQQAVSKSIGILEEALGVTLFIRSAGGVEPTIYADSLARRAKIILAEAQLVAGEISTLRNAQEGAIRLGMGWSFLYRIGPEAIERFRQRYPGVVVSVVDGNSMSLFPRLIDGELEFVVSAPPSDFSIDPSLRATRLYQERDWVVMGKKHPLSKKKNITLNDLAECIWLADFSIDQRWSATCDAFGAVASDPPKQVLRIASLALAKEMLHSGHYICLLSHELMTREIDRKEYRVVSIDSLAFTRWALLTERKGSPSQKMATVMKGIIQEVCSEYYPQAE